MLIENTLFILSKKNVKTIDLLKLSLIILSALISLDYIKKASNIILTLNANLER